MPSEKADGTEIKGDPTFGKTLSAWQKKHGRHNLPWQNTRDAYRVWLSEIMLQQTQVSSVIPYYEKFLASFPDVFSLAAAPPDAVMALWSGLGYYTRAKNLIRCAKTVVKELNGVFPSNPEALQKLPGIGSSTAAAIAVFTAGKKAAILDGNVIRVLTRVFALPDNADTSSGKRRLRLLAESLLPDTDIAPYTQGLMDLGSALCTPSSPNCPACPFRGRCKAAAAGNPGDYPVRRKKKPVPEKELLMLVLIRQGHVLLKKRPEGGIWGGLYSLPEAFVKGGDIASSAKELARQFGAEGNPLFAEPFFHSFTHMKLSIRPFIIRTDSPPIPMPGCQWVKPDEAGKMPLPAPVKKFLKSLSG